MELELTLDPADAAKLPRSKLFKGPRDRRARPQSVKLIWHDSPDRALYAEGLVVVEQRGAWRLERVTPQSAAWLPAQPAEVLATAPSAADLPHPMPDPLTAFAAFDGRQTIYEIPTLERQVTLRLVRGSLRSVAAVTPACRIFLEGPDQAVRDLALTLAEMVPVSVPRASLPAEALAAADGKPVPPRRLAAPQPIDGQDIAAAFGHVLGHLTDVLLYFAPFAAEAGADTEPVHQMRVAVRRARSAIAVFSHALACPGMETANSDLRALGTILAPTRDWDVFVTETLPSVAASLPDDARLLRLIAAAGRERAACHAALRAYLLSEQFRRLGIELAWLAASRSWYDTLEQEARERSEAPLQSYAASVLQRRWKKLLAAGKDLGELDVPALHGLRLRAKRARYAAEIFLPRTHSKPALRVLRRLSVLQQRLGRLNDGAVAAELMRKLGGPGGRHGYAVGLVQGFLAAGAARTHPRILRAWEKFRRTPVFWA